ncbi:hypothetical protein CUMW_041830 [Citrus unshiu]|nr:hypothetical protein CUMW_041830 [Citrus unshiu]
MESSHFHLIWKVQNFLYFSLSLAKPQLPFVTVATFGDTLIDNLVLFFWLSNKIPTSFMGEEDPKKPEPAGPSTAAKTIEEHDDPVKEDKESVPNGNAQRTFLNPFAQPPQVRDPSVEKSSWDSIDKGAALEQLEKEKKLALIKAWEENEKAKADNRAYKRLSAVGSWEKSKKAAVELQLKKFEEKWEKKKAEYEERIKNKVADINMKAEEKRAIIEAQRGEDFLKVEETAGKFRAAGFIPRKFLSCFG